MFDEQVGRESNGNPIVYYGKLTAVIKYLSFGVAPNTPTDWATLLNNMPFAQGNTIDGKTYPLSSTGIVEFGSSMDIGSNNNITIRGKYPVIFTGLYVASPYLGFSFTLVSSDKTGTVFYDKKATDVTVEAHTVYTYKL